MAPPSKKASMEFVPEPLFSGIFFSPLSEMFYPKRYPCDNPCQCDSGPLNGIYDHLCNPCCFYGYVPDLLYNLLHIPHLAVYLVGDLLDIHKKSLSLL